MSTIMTDLSWFSSILSGNYRKIYLNQVRSLSLATIPFIIHCYPVIQYYTTDLWSELLTAALNKLETGPTRRKQYVRVVSSVNPGSSEAYQKMKS